MLNVVGCPCCDLWREENFDKIKKDLIHFSNLFMIYKWNGIPTVISREHIIELPKETWGHVLKKVRDLYGNQARILWDDSRSKFSARLPEDHWCGVISVPKRLY